ncbi:MAG: polysaccharide biosynthesis/export family protein [Pseudomonas sp.]|uniref:polysaccharide biosynthesis/export family protein n=1 Tax=Pseudomonas abieticivorans TaxID=2931382 RepID=UPI0020C0E1A6|nr:polysaccharide biosynthesis/export family protein [Pseudomonas sp. PIA16]MDE1166982.1 polysaccharide biosynthesis/export family protein [Pseudomonas sp.]
MKRALFSVLLLSAVLQGCAFAPGQHMTPDDVQDGPDMSDVKVVPITQLSVQQQQTIYKAEPIPSELLTYRPEDYLIGPGDSLIITVWEHAELNSPAAQDQKEASARVVRNDGTLYYPYINSIHAGGLTVGQFRANLQKALATYLTGAQVDVNVEGYSSKRVIISGAVKNPGPQALTNTPLTLVDAISRSGGETADANLANLILKRDGHEYLIDIDTLNRRGSHLNEIYLKDGDQLHLGDNHANKIYVLGEVLHPQVMTYGTSTFNLMEALGNAGGISQETANAEAIYVIRGAQGASKQPATVFYLNAKKPTAFMLASQFDLQTSDVIFVGPANITRWNRFISQLLPSATVVGTTAAFSH